MTSTPSDNYLTYTRGVRSWLLTLDHKRIGVMYLASILLMFLLGGIFAPAGPHGAALAVGGRS